MRAAVDVELHRVLARRIEVRRCDVPALDLQSVRRRVPEILDLSELLAGQDVVVDGRELLDVGGSLDIEADDVGGRRRTGERADRPAFRADLGYSQHVRALRDRHHLAGAGACQRQQEEILRSFALRREIDAAAVGAPAQRGRRPVPVA